MRLMSSVMSNISVSAVVVGQLATNDDECNFYGHPSSYISSCSNVDVHRRETVLSACLLVEAVAVDTCVYNNIPA